MAVFTSPSRARLALVVVGAAACTGQIHRGADAPSSPNGGSGAGATSARGGAGTASGGAAGSSSPNPAACGYAPARLWKLTPQQYARTIERAAPGVKVSTDDLVKTSVSVGGFANDARSVDVSEPQVDALLASATDLATQVLARADAVAPCLATKPVTAACVRQTLTSFGERMFRRPLRPSELDAYVAFQDQEAKAHGADAGLRQLFRALFMSPNFLFRTELGDDAATPGQPTKLTAFERASALAYFLTDGPPDDALMDAARKDELATATQLESHARRLLATADGKRGIVGFFAEQLRIDNVRVVTKSASLTAWTPELAADLAEETKQFLAGEIWDGSGKLSGLLTSRTSFVNERVAKLYGVSGATGTQFRAAELPAPRVGLLGQASVLASLGQGDDTSIVKRGRFVRERLLCQSIPAAPPELANVAIPPRPDGMHTQRERIDRHAVDPLCAACHKFMDPIGQGMESFDTLGRYRALDVTGKPVVADGAVVDSSGTTQQKFAGFTELTQVLADSPEVRACMARQMFTYAQGREPDDRDACAIDSLNAAFTAANGDVRELAIKLAASDAVVTRVK